MVIFLPASRVDPAYAAAALADKSATFPTIGQGG